MTDLPILVYRGESAARTYSFGCMPAGFGWALCSVNDATGELSVCSDWGSWSYRWHVAHLGNIGERPLTLTEFIAGRAGSHAYLADKLTSDDRAKREVFSPELTVASLREYIRQCRRDTPDGKMDAAMARQLYDDLAEVLTHDVQDARDFVDRIWEIDNHEQVFDQCEDLRFEETGSYRVLLGCIIPALVEACNDTRSHLNGRARVDVDRDALPEHERGVLA